jgi:hypothetical protein
MFGSCTNEALEQTMSTEVTMPDSSVFGALMRGHAGVAQDLEQLRAKGEIIVVPWSTYTEIKKTPMKWTPSTGPRERVS